METRMEELTTSYLTDSMTETESEELWSLIQHSDENREALYIQKVLDLSLIGRNNTGREDLTEKILSGIVEIKTTQDQVEAVLDTVQEVNKLIDTVMAVGISTRCDENGEDTVLAPLLEELGYGYERAKTNMGLGRITNVRKEAA